MRIGIFSECYHPTMNGVVVSIDTFKESLRKRGHEVYIFAPMTKGFKDEDANHVFRVPSIHWPGQSYYPIALPRLSMLTKHLPELSLDIVHCQHLFTMGKLGLVTGKKMGIPVVYTYHTLLAEYVHYVPLVHFLAKEYVIRLSRNFSNQCDTVVTPSESMKRILKGYGVVAPIEVIPTGIQPKKFKHHSPEKVKARYGIPDDRQLLLFVGRLAEEKNLILLLETFEIVVRTIHNVQLLLVGGGPQENKYRDWLRRHQLLNHVTFTEFLEKEETDEVFGAADIFVFPSVTETQGIVITEAMASGTPPVAVDKMGPSDIIDNGQDGFLVKPLPIPFAEKIITLLRQPVLLEKMKQAGYKKAEEYSAENSADKMERLYVRLTNTNSAKSEIARTSQKSHAV